MTSETKLTPWSERPMTAGDIRGMFDKLAPRYNLLNDILSLGMHRLWKLRLVREIPAGAKHLDLCCGTGDIVELACRRKATTSVGLDFSADMIGRAKSRFDIISSALSAQFLEGDATNIPFADNSFDIVTISFGIRNIPDISRCLSEIRRVLIPGGKLAILEFGTPRGLFAPFYNLYSRNILPLVGAVVSGHSFAYGYLQETQSKFPCGEEFRKILNKNFISSASATALNAGLVYLYCGTSAKEATL